MRIRLFCCLVMLSLASLRSCTKNDNPGNPPNNQPPAVTPVGTPVGASITKNIGSGGGSLTSPDGVVELSFPAGAVASNTDITIQPVTNEAPGGIGLSYHLMPDGITFSKPVRLIYHYTNEDIRGTLPYLLYIAYQDSAFIWRADFKKRNVDTLAKTVSLDISHFSIWSMGDNLRLFLNPFNNNLYENETREISAVLVERTEPTGDDELAALPHATPLPDNAVSNWKINGRTDRPADGTISGTGAKVTYQAPSDIPQEKTVQISAELNYEIVQFNNGQQVASVNRLILFENITLHPSEFEYTVTIDYRDPGVSGYYPGQVYQDRASFDLTIKKTKDEHGVPIVIALGSNYVNYAPTVSPATQTYTNPGGSTFTWEWIPDAVGQTNIVDISVALYDDDSTIDIEFIHANTISPGFNWSTTLPTSSGSASPQAMGGTTGLPSGVFMVIKPERQTFHQVDGNPWIIVDPK